MMLLRASEIYEKAMEYVRIYGTRDTREIARDCGIFLFEDPGFSSLLGAYTCINDCRMIILNAQLSRTLEQIIIGHELGHDTFHRRHGLVDGIANGMQFLKEISEQEYEANALCAHLTLDNDEVINTIHMGYSLEECAGILETLPELLVIKIKELKRMGFDVPDVECNPRFLKTVRPDESDECCDGGFFSE